MRVLVAGVEQVVERAQVRSVLGLLAARAGSPVSADILIDHIWPDTLPKNPRAALSVNLSRVRSLFEPVGAPVLESSGAGYTLRADVDLHEFTKTANLGRAEATDPASVDQLYGAIALWRGTPFDGIRASSHTESIRLQTEGARWEIVNQLVSALSRAERFDEVVTLLTPLVNEAPYREGEAIALAKGLAGIGRKADALDLLSLVRTRLLDDLGLDASPLLMETEGAILDGTLDLGSVAQEQVKPTVFVGREDELAMLESNPALLTVVTGSAGSGKSTLLDAAQRRSSTNGRPIIVARAKLAPQRPTDVMATLVDELLTLIPGAAEAHRAALSRVVPELVPPSSDEPQLAERDALVIALAHFLAETCSHLGATIAIDDAQWVDPTSALVIERVIAAKLVPVVLAHRAENADAVQRFLHHEPDLLSIELKPLNRSAVAAVCQQLLGHERPETVDAIFERTHGHALFTYLATKSLLEAGAEDDLDELPESIVEAVAEGFLAVSMRCRETALVLSVFGPSCSATALRSLRPTADVDIIELRQAGLLRPATEPGVVEFTHRIISDGAYQLLAPARRVDLHDAVGRVIEDQGGREVEFVTHAAAAAEVDPRRAMDTHLQAAAQFASAFNWDLALIHTEAAQDLHDSLGGKSQGTPFTADALFLQGAAMRGLGKPSSMPLLIDSANVALEINDTTRLARSVIQLCSHGEASEFGIVNQEVADLFDATLERDIDTRSRAILCAAGATLFAFSAQHDHVEALFEEALTLSQSINDVAARCEVLLHTHLGFADPDRFDDRLALAHEMRTIAPNDPDLQWEAAFIEFGDGLVRAEPEKMEASLELIRALTPQARRRPLDFGYHFSEAAAAAALGNQKNAREQIDRLAHAGQTYPFAWTMAVRIVAELSLRIKDETVSDLLPMIDGLLGAAAPSPQLGAIASYIFATTGDLDRTREQLAHVTGQGFDGIERDITWTACFWLIAIPIAAIGTPEDARAAYRLLLPYSGRMAWTGTCIFGPVDEALAIYAEAAGEIEAAEDIAWRQPASKGGCRVIDHDAA